MKRAGNLIAQITDLNNLHEAFYKAAKGKQCNSEVVEYRNNLYNNLICLQQQIKSGNVDIGNYHYFIIYEPKERKICAAPFPQRVLHHALMNLCHQVFDNFQIEDSYATRKDKGQYKAIEKLSTYTKKCTYYAKLDVRKYFDSISHLKLKELLERRFKDKVMLQIFNKIIDSYSTTTISQKIETFEKLEQRGLPIGNLTSQYFANYYMAFTDRFAKQTLKTQYYVRYMDDIIICSNNKAELQNNVNKLEQFIFDFLHLQLKIKIVNSIKYGISFLGYRIFQSHITLNQNSKQRFKRKLKLYYKKLNNDIWTQQEFQIHATPLFAFVEKSKSYRLRQSVLNRFEGNNQSFEPR